VRLRGIAISFCLLMTACAAGAPSPNQDLDFSTAEVCPAGYYHDIVHMTHFSTYPPESRPIPPEDILANMCPAQIPPSVNTNERRACPEGQPQRVELNGLNPSYVCICQASPWGISKIYWGGIPAACQEWQSLNDSERRKHVILVEQRRNTFIQKLRGTSCHIQDFGDKGFAIRCSPPSPHVTQNDFSAVGAAMPDGCSNLRLARFSALDGRHYSRGFVFDCAYP
jgi:hypothetical protein